MKLAIEAMAARMRTLATEQSLSGDFEAESSLIACASMLDRYVNDYGDLEMCKDLLRVVAKNLRDKAS